jgi:hypothetical protein
LQKKIQRMFRSYFISAIALAGLIASDACAAEAENIFERPMMFDWPKQSARRRVDFSNWHDHARNAGGVRTLCQDSQRQELVDRVHKPRRQSRSRFDTGRYDPAKGVQPSGDDRSRMARTGWCPICFSACGYAFLGGRRKIQDGA